MNKKLVIITIISILIIASVGIYTLLGDEDGGYLFDLNEPGQPRYNYMQGGNLMPGNFNLSTVFNDLTGDFRPAYSCLTDDVMYEWYFGELPDFPKDFFRMAQLVYDGKFVKYEELGEEFWKQPEFFPGWWDTICTRYVSHDVKRWTPEGYGVYPMIKEISVSETGVTILVTAYFRTGYATHAFQGIIIRPYLPGGARSILGNTIFEQPSNAQEYISVNIANPDDEIYESFKNDIPYTNVNDNDWFTILKPTHQIHYDKYGNKLGESGFPDDWVRIMELEIEIAEGTPSGDYVVAIDIVPPCFEINQEYYYSNSHPSYGYSYYPAGHFHHTTAPHFQAIVHVE